MSEENTTQETTQPEATETPTPPAMDLDSTIKVDGQEVSVRELINSRDEATKLREYNEQARKLIAPNQGGTEDREQAIRFLMTQEGYSPEDINEYVNWSSEMGQEPTQEYYEEPQYDGTITDEEVQQQYYQEQMMREQEQQRMSEIEDRQSRIGTEMMKKEMSSAIDTIMGSSKDISKLMGVSEGEENNRGDILRHEVETAMMDSLRRRRASGETFNNNWFTEEAGNAAKSVYDKFRSVIGDPDKIQRSPETATEDSLFNKPPVDPPKYERGDDMGDINIKARDWTLDTLLRGAQEGAAGGESKA
jgi:hypothetical protein